MMTVEFIRAHRTPNGVLQIRGSKMRCGPKLAQELIKKGVARIYDGPWPPTTKSKLKL